MGLFSRFSIKQLHKGDEKAAIELYAECCRNDSFYCRYFHTEDCYYEILDTFGTDVANTIAFGVAYGTFEKGKLVGILLGFNVHDWRNNHTKAYNHCFMGDSTFSDAWFDAVTSHFRELNEKIIYTYTVCVDRDYRGNHIASNMIQTLVRRYGSGYVLFSDADTPVARSMWLNNKFQQITLTARNSQSITGFYRK